MVQLLKDFRRVLAERRGPAADRHGAPERIAHGARARAIAQFDRLDPAVMTHLRIASLSGQTST
jgi:hypothetical protein